MIFTREQQHKMLAEYTKKKDRNVDEITGFIDGILETIKLIDSSVNKWSETNNTTISFPKYKKNEQ
jgi:hypothetical protein